MSAFSIINFFVATSNYCSDMRSASHTKEKQGMNGDYYYWREYTGQIPSDALHGGLDLNQKTTYIGHGFLLKYGIIPGIIYQNKKEMKVPLEGVKTLDRYIMILCSPYPNAFKWCPVTDKNFKNKTVGKNLVTGGIESNCMLSIGRILFEGELVTGKIVINSPYYPDTTPMFFEHGNAEHKATEYEVLVYEN